MKVAFVLGTTAGGTLRHVQMLAAGGAVRGVPALVCGPAEHEPDFRFGAPGAPGEPGLGPAHPGAAPVSYETVQFGDRPSVRDGLAVLRLRQVLGRHRPDVVHAHGLRAGALAALALTLALRPARAALPLVVTVHNAPPAGGVNGTIYQSLQFLAARSAAVVLCVSGDLEDRMRRAGARDVRRALVPPYSPTTPAPAEDGLATPGAIAQELRTQDRPLILAAGRLAPQKGFDTLIEAARTWQDLTPAPLLAIAGSGPLHDQLAAAAAPLGGNASLLGQRADVPALLAAAAVFVLPSRWEGQPLILQEALRAGRPIVATRAGGTPDLTGEDAALLVPPDDPAGLAEAVRRVLTDQALATRLADAARDRARTLPSVNEATEAALAVYREVSGTQRELDGN
ncbi:MAG TPA: glycosyltransferase family 4 protein [Streptosporangiaceae bacterium]